MIRAYIQVILKCGLNKKVWCQLHGVIDFPGLFGAKRRASQQCVELSKGIADLAVHKTAGNVVLFPVWKRSIELHARSYLLVLASYVTRAPIETECRIQSTIRSGVRTV